MTKNNISTELNFVIQKLRMLWLERRLILRVFIFSSLMGILISFLIPEKFSSQIVFITQDNESSLSGNLGGIASLAGINLKDSGGETLSPDLYAKVVSSSKFQLELINKEFYFESIDSTVSFRDYYLRFHEKSPLQKLYSYTIGLPGTIKKSFSSHQVDNNGDNSFHILELSVQEVNLLNELSDHISINYDERMGYSNVRAIMDEPTSSAQLCQALFDQLQQYLYEIKTNKARNQLQFLENRYSIIFKEFENIQIELAQFEDQNRNLNTSKSKMELIHLESRYNLKLSIIQELERQIENQQLKVNKEIPMFTILKPVFIPKEKSNTSKSSVVMFFITISLIISTGYIFYKGEIFKIQELFKKEFNLYGQAQRNKN